MRSGSGSVSLAVHGVLFDRPGVIGTARDTFGPGLAGRVDLVAGDFFESVPPGDALTGSP